MRPHSVKPRRASAKPSTASNAQRAGSSRRSRPTPQWPVPRPICGCSARRPAVACWRKKRSRRCVQAMVPAVRRWRDFLPKTLRSWRTASNAVSQKVPTASPVRKPRLRNSDHRTGLLMSLKGKTLFITGGSRGIGLAIALKAAADGANIAVAAKTVEPHPKLEGTIHTAAVEIAKAGGRALPIAVDVRDEASVQAALDETADKFGGIDIVVNNASAIQLTPVTATDK